MPLQRALTDFGADVSFGEASKKMKEHYGIEVPACAIEKITLQHAEKMSEWVPEETQKEAQMLIAEIDGGMVPIVEVGQKMGNEEKDLRKTRKVLWKEAKLCFARDYTKIDRIYGAVIGSPDEAGQKLYQCAERAGFTENTYVHGLGDGAPWIVDQMENQFGAQSHFLIDFFHMCEYLSEAASWCDVLNPQEWLEQRKKMMKEGEHEKVLEELQARRSQLETLPESNGLDKCIGYFEKRISYMNYAEAQAKELAIGSGEIESSHRHVVQKRLKIAGAWWKENSANLMLQLRTARANNDWETYWMERKNAA